MFKTVFFLLSLIFFSQNLRGQKVALVLSGGGAKGLAHLGVIKALEEAQIPIDYIVGTSMGGVIGAMYASGYTTREMEEIIASKSFQNWVNGKIDDKYRYFLYKETPNSAMFPIKIKLDSSLNVSFNTSLINDSPINFQLAEYFAEASNVAKEDFDSLMTPFRCLGSDIFTQEQIILKNGSLSSAVRATLNVPLFFRPIRVNGKYIYDGGIYNNFPVDIARKEFKPDIIIGVNVSSKNFTEYPKDKDDKLIQNALLYMFLAKSDSSQLNKNDIYIEPYLKNHTALDFKDGEHFVKIGYITTKQKIKEIKSKITKKRTRGEIIKKRQLFKKKFPKFRINQVEIISKQKSAKKYVSNIFSQRKNKRDLYSIKKRYFRLVESEKFELLYPQFQYDTLHKKYDFRLKAKPDRSIKAAIGGNLSTRRVNHLYLGLEYNYIRNLLYSFQGNFYSGRFYLSTQWKTKIHIPTKVPLYIEPYFTFNRWNFTNIDEIIFNNQEETILNQNDTKFGLNISVAAGHKGKINFGYGHFINNDRYNSFNTVNSGETLDFTKFEGEVFEIKYLQSSLNRKQFASRGFSLELSANFITGRERFTPGTSSVFERDYQKFHDWLKFSFSIENYFKLGNSYKLALSSSGAWSSQGLFRNYKSSLINLPAFYPIIDSQTLFLENLRSTKYATVGIKNIFHLTSNLELRQSTFLFNDFQKIEEINPQIPQFSSDKINLSLIGNVGFVYHTVLAPISLHLNYYQGKSRPWGVFFNIGYLIYNKRSLE